MVVLTPLSNWKNWRNDFAIESSPRYSDQKYFDENFIRPLTESQMDESPSISPNGNVIVYAIREEGMGLLSGVTLSGAKFKLPASEGAVREPSWSGFLR